MVAVDSHQKLLRLLELFLLKQADCKLPVKGYELIALMPVDPNSWSDTKTLLLSADALLQRTRWDITYELLVLLRQGLEDEQYLEIYSVDIIEPTSFAVQQINSRYSSIGRETREFEIPIQAIGGVTNQTITIIRSSVLEQLAYYKPVRVHLVDGREIIGKLIGIQWLEADTKLDFETNDGSQSCLFTEIARLVS